MHGCVEYMLLYVDMCVGRYVMDIERQIDINTAIVVFDRWIDKWMNGQQGTQIK